MQTQRIGFFSAYGATWRNYANFSSRTSKEAFWKAYFIHGVIMLALASPGYYIYESIIERGDLSANILFVPNGVYALATIIPTIALILRRLHDTDRHGCWICIAFVPIAGAVILLIMLARDSAPYDVFPGRSGSGPYAPPQPPQPIYGQPQQQAPYPNTYGQPPQQNPYAPPQPIYGQPPQQPGPYAPPQPPQPMYGQPQQQAPYPNTYGQPQQQPNPYAPGPFYFIPLPPPRRYAPQGGGNRAAAAIVMSIIILVCGIVNSLAVNLYLQENMDRYLSVVLGESLFSDRYMDDFYDDWNDLYGGEWEYDG